MVESNVYAIEIHSKQRPMTMDSVTVWNDLFERWGGKTIYKD